MASIYITEVDSTIYGLSNTSADNVVFVPGTAITGPDAPTLCQSYKEFTNIFGDTPPASSDSSIGTNWEYAANILIAGFPVLYKRIINNSSGVCQVVKASANITYNDGTTTHNPCKVEELYGGTFGNNLKYSIVFNAKQSIYLRIHQTYTIGTTSYTKQIESVKLVDLDDTDTDETTKNKLIKAVGSGFVTNYVKLSLKEDEKNYFYIKGNISETSLTGGSDIDEYTAWLAGPAVYNDTTYDLSDKLIYDFKFITAGGWYNITDSSSSTSTTIDFMSQMRTLADSRQDCIAVVDVPYELSSSSVRTYFTDTVNINSSYCTAYAPWAKMSLDTGTTAKWMAPSYVFIHTLARSIKSGNKIWFPPAGVRRATVGEIVETQYDVGSNLLDDWQNNSPQYINPIMKLRNYGYVIYGQRTLYRSVDGSVDNRSALQELGVRIIANEIKRYINDIALSLTFEHNNIHTWNEFIGALEPKLLQMKTDGALYGYEIIMDETTTTSSDVDENRIVGIVRANITRAAEDFEIGFELTASSVSLTEE